MQISVYNKSTEIKPHLILVVYHTEFQLNFHPSSVVKVDILYYFMFI